jgi:hypothetical protein
MSCISYNEFDKRLRDLEIICEQRITKHITEAELRMKDMISSEEDRIIEMLSSYLDDSIDELLETKVIEKCLEVNDNIDAILKSRDDDEIVRKFCQKYLKDNK